MIPFVKMCERIVICRVFGTSGAQILERYLAGELGRAAHGHLVLGRCFERFDRLEGLASLLAVALYRFLIHVSRPLVPVPSPHARLACHFSNYASRPSLWQTARRQGLTHRHRCHSVLDPVADRFSSSASRNFLHGPYGNRTGKPAST